jgi:hypothetical protein
MRKRQAALPGNLLPPFLAERLRSGQTALSAARGDLQFRVQHRLSVSSLLAARVTWLGGVQSRPSLIARIFAIPSSALQGRKGCKTSIRQHFCICRLRPMNSLPDNIVHYADDRLTPHGRVTWKLLRSSASARQALHDFAALTQGGGRLILPDRHQVAVCAGHIIILAQSVQPSAPSVRIRILPSAS